MKKLTVLVAVMLIAGLLSGCWLFPEKLTIPELDGIVSLGEWDDATEISVAGDMGTVKVLATTDYLYVLFDNVKDSTDARLGENVHFSDKVCININPTEGGEWGKPYDIIFATGADPNSFTNAEPPRLSSGMSDSWYTEWIIEGTQYDIPEDLETKTIYSDPRYNRVSEWKVPLDSMALSSGDVIKVGGKITVDEGGYVYPIGLDYLVESTYFNIIVH